MFIFHVQVILVYSVHGQVIDGILDTVRAETGTVNETIGCSHTAFNGTKTETDSDEVFRSWDH